jgi:hypothetical protein
MNANSFLRSRKAVEFLQVAEPTRGRVCKVGDSAPRLPDWSVCAAVQQLKILRDGFGSSSLILTCRIAG